MTSGHIDVRVAGAPIVGLRFHLDSRAADLDERADELERRLIEVGVQRANLMVGFVVSRKRGSRPSRCSPA